MDMLLYHCHCDFGRCRHWSGGVLFAASEQFMNDVVGLHREWHRYILDDQPTTIFLFVILYTPM
jgi:hypothetical protein